MSADQSNQQVPDQNTGAPVRQLRLVVEADDYEQAVTFYRDVLGLPERAAFQGAETARVATLDAGRATLEIADPAQKRMVDEVEVGRQVAPHLRVAFEVDDTTARTSPLQQAGAEVIAAPVRTPWNSLNARLHAPTGLQITLFQELSRHTRTRRDERRDPSRA
ncbi:VOC family protein [Kineococcus esterisolvens]|uniref:VOC family protein n=1 Tax=unclassified Kineococcus TaxID=2621656 RepID=UPI003D7EE0CB